MTTQGGMSYQELVQMDDKERMWWYQKAVDYNEEMEEGVKPRGTTRR